MKARRFRQLDKRRLQIWLLVFFILLLTPTGVLVYHAYDQLKWEAFHLHNNMAEELSNRIDNRFNEIISAEEARPFTAYSFLNVAGDNIKGFLQRSPLSNLPVNSDISGIIGYFQIDPQEQFSTPLLPVITANLSNYGISDREAKQRRAIQKKIFTILSQNQLIKDQDRLADLALPGRKKLKRDTLENQPAETDAIARSDVPKFEAKLSQEAFDELAAEESAAPASAPASQSLGKVEDIQLESKYNIQVEKEKQTAQKKSAPRERQKFGGKRTEKNILPEQRLQTTPALPSSVDAPAVLNENVKIEIFESEIDPFELARLDSGQFVLYRKVWRNKQRYIQGILIEADSFIRNIVEPAFRETLLSDMSDLTVAYQGNIMTVISAAERRGYLSRPEQLQGTLLYRTRLAAPLSGVELIYSVRKLPAGPGGQVIVWSSVILLVVLLGVFFLMYRLGTGQINLARQQQDFVSAISHELKTPLTSIRMYGEMLREGWADDNKKKTYYDFIFTESERLSRLINNVLQLARMTRNDLDIDLKPYSIAETIDTIRSKVSSQAEQHGFKLTVECDVTLQDKQISVDMDYLVQIVINLTDNAIKFSSKSERKEIEIRCQAGANNRILLSVRDYGPGIAGDQMKKIFRLFYRTESELTRETVGTGIGLALVNQLTLAMGGTIDVIRHEPGAEFVISLPVTD